MRTTIAVAACAILAAGCSPEPESPTAASPPPPPSAAPPPAPPAPATTSDVITAERGGFIPDEKALAPADDSSVCWRRHYEPSSLSDARLGLMLDTSPTIGTPWTNPMRGAIWPRSVRRLPPRNGSPSRW